ncbi:MAG: glutathione S-transferase [Gammaproteobacteria bacterium]|nr:glutathione S-transferase [Gammaproteobacteria bacterium]
MLTLHHLENSRSQRILWLLEELGVDYKIQSYTHDPKTSLAPAELFAVHSPGKSPVITDGDLTVAESGAIIEYLVAKVRGGYLGANTTLNLEYMEAALGKSRWFCGEAFTAADIQMSFALEAAEVRTNLAADYPGLAEFLKTIRAMPAYRKGIEMGGPYALMGDD